MLKKKNKLNRAGVVPFIQEDNQIKMLFMKPSNGEYGGKYFQIAKGKQEEGESIEETALRESNEELGLFRGNIIVFEEVGTFLGRTTIFIAGVKDKDLFGDPHHETEITKWLSLNEFIKEGRDLHKPVVKAAHRKIMKSI